MRATAAQRGLWYAHSVAPDPAVFTIGHLVDFDGAVDVERLTPAVRGALDESDGLRSRFDEVDGDLLVTLGAAVEVGRDHLGGNPALIDDVAAQAVATPMDPVAGPVAAVTILSAGERISLLIVAHHIVLDAYGIGLFTRRVAQLYADPDGGRPLRPISSLPDDVDASVDGDAEFWDTETSGIPDPSSLSGGPGIHRIARAVRSTAIVVDGVATTPPGRLTAAIVAFCARSTDAAEVVLGFPMMNRFGSPAANTPCTLSTSCPCVWRRP